MADDEAKIREVYDALISAWAKNSAEDYAAVFTHDAEYIVASGVVEHGRAEIIAGHQQIFDTWAKGSTLRGEITSIKWLTPDVALVLAGGSVLEAGSTDSDEVTVYSLVALRDVAGKWLFAAYQNTPVISYG